MGQRHQIYVALPEKYYYEGNPNNRPQTVIGIHHQWLYGYNAIRRLRNFVEFYKNSDKKYGPFSPKTSVDHAMGALTALYSIDVQDGYYHGVHDIYEDGKGVECFDPRKGDNNNGITIIDLTQPELKYCFMSVGHLECLDKTMENRYKNFSPMSAEDYLLLHYPKIRSIQEVDPDAETFRLEAIRCLEELEPSKVLKLSEVKKLFPAMFLAEAKQSARI